MEELKEVFQKYSRGDGSLSKKELRRALNELGMGNKRMMNTILEEADADGDGELDLGEFLSFFGYAEEDEDDSFDQDEAEAVFDYYSQGDGEMQTVELRRALLSLGLASGRREVRRMLQSADEDGSGTLDRHEFVMMMRMLHQRQAEETNAIWDSGEMAQGLLNAAVGLFGGAFFGSGGGYVEEQAQQPTVVARPKISKALFIGINYPGTSSALRGCVNDVRTLRNLLERTLQFPISETRILVDDGAESFHTSHGEGRSTVGVPTHAEIIKGMQWLVSGAKAGDTLILHYSGHGTSLKESIRGSEASGHDEAICPSDYEKSGCLRDDDMFRILVSALPPGVRLTAIFDCCHSGTILDLPFVADFGSREVQRNERATTANPASVLMFSGCRDDQTSADAYVHQRDAWGGALTTALSTLLSESKQGLPIGTMLEKMRANLVKDGYSQVPQLSSTHPFRVQGTFSFFGASVEEL